MEISTTQSLRIRMVMLLLFTLFLLRGFAQDQVSAKSIMKDIREGKMIRYSDVVITGDLDFTFMDEKLPDLPKKAKWWNSGNGNTVEESIDVQIEFRNCVFKNEVQAYIHDDKSGYTFVADFDKAVTFQDCTFEDDAMFKYSDFDSEATFSGSKFMRNSTFKYAGFEEPANFEETYFNDDATFKYAKFEEGVSFREARFDESWNIKYMKARGDFNISGLQVEDDIDAKYTKINGDSFTKYLVESKD